ncbi:hypothetical protein [Brevundimonas sp.]|uniref:hypothetical protein n=1 Tax=Brevundimonas sp. TaxID=1871086 RepID=UPI003AF5FA19
MKAERFQAIVEAYGADPARWPEAERDSALAWADQAGQAAQAILAEARALDVGLAGYPAPLPDAAAFARALKGADAALAPAARARGFRLPGFRLDRFRLASGAGLMAAACAGVMFGVTLTDRLTADAQADAVLYQATLSGIDDTEVLG